MKGRKMDKAYVQNLRYKLQKRVRRLNSTEHQLFPNLLKHFWGFLKNYPVFLGIIEEIEKHLMKKHMDFYRDFLNGLDKQYWPSELR